MSLITIPVATQYCGNVATGAGVVKYIGCTPVRGTYLSWLQYLTP